MTRAEAVLDLRVLHEQTAGDDVLAREILAMFRDQARQRLPELATGNLRRQTEVAHLLKGSCLGIGAVQAAVLLTRYEGANPSQRRAIASALVAAFEALEAAIDARLAAP